MHLWQMLLLSVGLATLHPQGQLNRQPQCSSEPQASCTYEQKVSNAAWIPRWFECSFRWEHFDAAKFCHLDIKWVMQQICCSATVNFVFFVFFLCRIQKTFIYIYIYIHLYLRMYMYLKFAPMNQHQKQNKTKKKICGKTMPPTCYFQINQALSWLTLWEA